MNRIHSIRFKITIISVAAVLIAILSIFIASYSSIREESDRRSVEIMRLIRQDTANTLNEYFEGIEQSVSVATNMAVDSLDPITLVECGVAGHDADSHPRTPEQIERMDAYLGEHCELVRQVFESVATHTNGVITYYYCINPEVSENEHGFYYRRVGKAGYVEQEPLDATKFDPADEAHTGWYFTPIRRGRPTWVGPYPAMTIDDMWLFSYVVPIYSTGTLIGVLGMDIPLDTLIDQVKPIRVYDTGFASLSGEDGAIIYHPEIAMGDKPSLNNLSVPMEVLEGEDSGDELIHYTSHDEERQMSFTTLYNGMRLFLTAPVKEIKASWLALVRKVMIITIVVIIVLAIIILLIMRLITNPLHALTKASQRLAASDYNVELSYHSRDEIGKLTNAFATMRDQMKSYIADLNNRILTDNLTGLPNMRHFFTLAKAKREQLISEGRRPVMLYFDLIGMKHFNRQHGFEEGDQLLREIGQVLAARFGEDSLCRFTGDHFAVVAGEDGLEETLRLVFREIEELNGGNSLPVRVGIYRSGQEDAGVSIACDRAKYACDQHRGSYVSGYYYFDEDMLGQLDDVRYIIGHLDQALEEHWIQVYYQPIIRAVNGRVCDEEALARWIDPERGILSPASFIPILEEARLIYRLDLYVLEQVLEKMAASKENGLRVVPHSLNLSRTDFDMCDIVDEICRRVDQAGVAHDRLTIEITESIIGSDFEFMKEQVRRFQELGFQVWMDDFGSGYSSLDVLGEIHFDLVKLDMRFLQRFGEGEEGKVILRDLVHMAVDLGIDTVCEGVETVEEVEFLREIGCTKLQGYYYCRPIPFEQIMERYRKGTQIGFENPAESDYFDAIGRVNLFDISVIADSEEARNDYFDMIPAGIVEVRLQDRYICFARTNQAFRDFMERYYGFEIERTSWYPVEFVGFGNRFRELVRQCMDDGNRVLYDGKLSDGSTVHVFVNRIAENKIAGMTAVAVAVLSITKPDDNASYADLARALAADYYNIYVVDLDTEQFVEYTSPVGGEELAEKRHGEQFFEAVKRDALIRIYKEDQEQFLSTFSKEKIVRDLEEQGVFTTTYRLTDYGTPMYVNMKITRMPGGNRIIMGISIIDAQMKEK